MPRPRSRARRSQYHSKHGLPRHLASLLAVVFVLGILVGASFAAVRVMGFLGSVTGQGNPLTLVQQQVDPPAGSVAYKLQHGQQVSILMLGYGGAENDAPYLTDSMLAVTLDPAGNRVMEASIPRDIWIDYRDAFADGHQYYDKINAAFEIGSDPTSWKGVKPDYSSRDGGGRLAEFEVGRLTGIHFDRYAAMDFKAFRDMVDALSGIDVHLATPLDDCHYPDYRDGYINHGVPLGYRCPPGSGIHFKAGDYAVNGEQALELARSRDATEPEQATDFARSKRQQMIIGSIRKKALSANAITRAPQLMDALQKDFKTDMDVNDLKAIYDFGGKLPEGAFIHLALTNQNLLEEYFQQKGSCGPWDAYVLCPSDPTYRFIHTYLQQAFVDPKALKEGAPVQFANASRSSTDLELRVTDMMQAWAGPNEGPGLKLSDGVRRRFQATSVIYDYSGGQYPLTAQWLSQLFNAQVLPATAASPAQIPAPGEKTTGLVVVMGTDFAQRFYGLT